MAGWRRGLWFGLFLALLTLETGVARAGATLERVRQANLVTCGVTVGGKGFVTLSESGRWEGMFADMCRVIAAAATGDAENVQFVELSNRRRFEAVRDEEVDVLTAGTTWTLERQARLGLAFPIVYFYDGQGFMVHKSMGVSRLADLKEGKICVTEGTTTIDNLLNYLPRSGKKLTLSRHASTEGALNSFFKHHCDVYSTDRGALFGYRTLSAPNPDDYVVFPEVISKEPLGPAVKQGDWEWSTLVHAAIAATLLAEEKGITAANATDRRGSPDSEVARLLGGMPGVGAWLGLDDAWAFRVITQVGNYAEIFERHFGPRSPVRMERGVNALWSQGGLLYVPPLGG